MLKQLFTKTLDALSDWTGCVATRVPLRRASGPDEVTLDLPGYAQLDSYGCGAVAGFMALKHFKPRASFTAFYARVSPHPENGTATYRPATETTLAELIGEVHRFSPQTRCCLHCGRHADADAVEPTPCRPATSP